ncbi:MAG TPA: ABC transporter permease [Longimicrobiales bacterium]
MSDIAWRTIHELTHALRSVRKGRGLTLAVVLVLGLGIGAAATFFSLLDGLLLRPLSYGDPGTLVALNEARVGEYSYAEVTSGTFRALRSMTAASFAGIEGYRPDEIRLSMDGEVRVAEGARITPGLLALLGVAPALGAVPVAGAPDSPRLVVLSDGLWRGAFGGDPDVVGRTIVVAGQETRVAAVMPPGFGFPQSARLWLVVPELAAASDAETVNTVARLAPGISLDEARGELDRLSASLAEREGMGVGPRLELRDEVVQRSGGGLGIISWFFFASGILLLLLVATNVAALVTVWHVRRRGELAVRAALGAGPGRLLGRSLAESTILALLGGALGLGLARIGMAILPRLLGANMPSWFALRLDGRVVLFTTAASLGAVFLFGLGPAKRASRLSLEGTLRGAAAGLTPGRAEQRRRRRLVGAQVAISTLLVGLTALFVSTAAHLGAVDPGYPAANILALRLAPPEAESAERSGLHAAALAGRLERCRAAVAALDGVAAVSYEGGLSGLVSGPVVGDARDPLDVRPFVNGRSLFALGLRADVRVVGPDYLRAMGLERVEGRGFAPGDTAGAPLVGLITRSGAERLWRGEQVLGRRLTLGADGPAIRIIGVVADRNQVVDGRRGTRVRRVEEVYLSAAQARMRTPEILVRTDGPALERLPAVRDRLAATTPAPAVARATTLAAEFGLAARIRWILARVLLFLAAAALLISVIGLFGLVAELVARRRREIGIRLALGAEPRRLVRTITWPGLRLTVLGAALGLGLAAAAAPLVGIFLYDSRLFDPLTLLTVLATMLGAGGLASYLPARRTAGVEPTEALAPE